MTTIFWSNGKTRACEQNEMKFVRCNVFQLSLSSPFSKMYLEEQSVDVT